MRRMHAKPPRCTVGAHAFACMRKLRIARIDNERWRESRRGCGWGWRTSEHAHLARAELVRNASERLPIQSTPHRTPHSTHTRAHTLTHTPHARPHTRTHAAHPRAHTRAIVRAAAAQLAAPAAARFMRTAFQRCLRGRRPAGRRSSAEACVRGTCICSGRSDGGAATVGLPRRRCNVRCTVDGLRTPCPAGCRQRLARGAPRRCA